MKCRNCKMIIPRSAKYCPNCSSKQGTGGGTIALAVILVGGILFFIGKGRNDKNDTSSTSVTSNAQYGEMLRSISAECSAIGIPSSKIRDVQQISPQGDNEKYQFSFENLSFTVEFNDDGSLKNICCGSNEMYSEGQAKIKYMNGFLVGDSSGETNGDSCTVSGIVLNATGSECPYAEITIGFYGSGNIKISSGIDNILNLKNNEQWRYTVYGFGTGIKNYKIEGITWY